MKLRVIDLNWRRLGSYLGWAGAFVVFVAFGTDSFAFAVGNRVEANMNVQVRQTAAGTSLGIQNSGSRGTITAGPQTASLSGTSHVWWQVDWDSSLDGWCAEEFLTLVTATSAPSISLLEPTSFTASNSNQTLTINGSNFSSSATLTFHAPIAGDIQSNAAKLTFVSASKITYQFNSGTDVGSWTVKVNNPGGQSSSTASFTVNAAAARPTISLLDPTSFTASNSNQTLIINGSNFSSSATLTFHAPIAGDVQSNAAKLTWVSANKITYQFNSGTDVGSWTVKVNNPDGQSSDTANFTVNAAATTTRPTISLLDPTSFTASSSNQTLTINGSNFSSNATLTFHAPIAGDVQSNAAKLTWVSANKITYQFNSGTDVGSWTVKVNNPDGQSSDAASFTVNAAATTTRPTISLLDPTSFTASSSNQTLTINGSNLSSNATLTFHAPIAGDIQSNATKLTFVSTNKITYQFNSGTDVGSWTVKVNNPDGQSSDTASFAVNAAATTTRPMISLLDPTSFTASNSNQTLTINGSNFSSSATLTFRAPIAGDVQSNAAKLTWVSVNKITYQFNSGTDVGSWTVKVNNPDGQSSDAASFTVNAAATTTRPTISLLDPTSFTASSSNQTLTINGSNFSSSATLTFHAPIAGDVQSNAAKLTWVSANKITYQFNSGTDVGSWTVKVNNPDGQSSDAASFTVNAATASGGTSNRPDPATAPGIRFSLPLASDSPYHYYFDRDRADVTMLAWNGSRAEVPDGTYDNHTGTDFSGIPRNTTIYAAAAGTLMDTKDGWPDGNKDENDHPNGNYVRINHGNDSTGTPIISVYLHMNSGSVTKKEMGSWIEAGEPIGKVGMSGKATGVHLHFETQRGVPPNRMPFDPYAAPGETSWWGPPVAAPSAYVVTPSAGANGTINPTSAQNIARGGRASFSAAPSSGYVVDQWLVNGSGAQSGGTGYALENINAPATVSVTFKLVPSNSSASSAFATQPLNQAAFQGGTVTLSAPATSSNTGVQWQRNGSNIFNATNSTLSLDAFQPASAGLYTAVTTGGATTAATAPAIVGTSSVDKVVGAGSVIGTGVVHPNGNTFDQVLLTGSGEAITADAGKVTRTSFIDLTNDIVQVEFSGAGTLSLVLDGSAAPAPPVNYNQPTVSYVKGHAGIVITGANETTNLSIFSVGRATAFDPTGHYDILKAPSATNLPANNGSSLFQGHVDTAYDGIADLAYVAISSTNGKFGGIRAANTHFFAVKGMTGVYAPGIVFQGPLFIGNVDAFDSAIPTIQVGSVTDARITGGDMAQDNGSAVQVTGLTQLSFTSGIDSQGRDLSAKNNRGVFQQNGQTITAQLVRETATTDTAPDAFTFTDVTSADPNTAYTSNTITIAGINAASAISITGGTYNVNGGAYTNASGIVNNGDRVSVRLTSSTSALTKLTATLTIGGVSDAYEITTKATTPVAYTVTVSAGSNGTISPTGTQSVMSGGSITFTATPANNYNVSQWLVNGSVVANSQTSYMLTNVTANTTVQVTFVAQATSATAIASGDAKTGTLGVGARANWSIVLSAGDSVVIRVGTGSTSPSFAPQLQVYDPSGTIVRSGSGNTDAMLNFQVTTGGTYSIVVSSYYTGDSGSYRLSAIKAPGTQTIPAGDEGGVLTNGGAHDGTITLGDIDPWTITAAVGETFVVRMGRQTGNFSPQLLLFDPSGNQVRSVSGNTDATFTYQATIGGTYTVVASSYYSGDTGTYRLHVVKAPGALTVPTNDEGGVLTNGSAHDGMITNGDLDPWTITAAVGETLVVRIGRQTGNFSPQLFLFDPSGNQVRSVSGNTDAGFTYQATTGGTYTVVASSYYNGDTGTYRLHVVKAPGTLILSPGDEGGALVNGGAHEGTLTTGDLDAWTISAAVGESLLVRMGVLTGSFSPQLYLIDPSGNLVRTVSGNTDAMLTYQASVGGTYTIVASSYYNGETGTYRLHAVKTPGTLSVPSGDDGGAFTPGVARDGTITIGDLDAWTISASANAQISFQVERLTGSLTPQVFLYDPSGNFVRSSSGSPASISYQTSVGGTYTAVVSSYYNGDTGMYRIR